MSERRPTKRERRDEGRRQREELARQQRRRDAYRRAWIAIGVVAAAAVVVSLFLLSGGDDPGSGEPPEGVENFQVASRSHVEGPVDYPQDPPVGGDHAGVWLNCAAYDFPVPSENAVHSMEHGAVWITYDASQVSGDELDALKAEMPSSYAILSPYDGLDSPIVMSAWNAQLKLDSASDERIPQFFEEYWRSQDVPEPNALCSGALDAPGKVS